MFAKPKPPPSGEEPVANNSDTLINTILDHIPATPLKPAAEILAQYPIAIPIIIVGIIVGAHYGWKNLTQKHNNSGRPLYPLRPGIKRAREIAFKLDKNPVLNKPPKLAKKLTWLTWTRYTKILTLITILWLITPPTNLLQPPQQTLWWLYGLAPIIVLWLILTKHVRFILQVRHRMLMQMFEVAQSEMKYLGGAELNPWGYIQITEWVDLYAPGVTVIMYPAKYRSEDSKNREAFETNFNGTVSDQHTWTYQWESANNRAIATPVPYITEQAPYQFPDTHPWYEIPLGIAAGGKEAVWKVSDFPHCLIAGTTGSGKLMSLTTRIPVPVSDRHSNGWTTFDEILPGDTVFDEKGNPCQVTGISDINTTPDLYEIEFSDGSIQEADADHLWWTKTRPARENGWNTARKTVEQQPLIPADKQLELKQWVASKPSNAETTLLEVASTIGVSETSLWLRTVADELGPVSEIQVIANFEYHGQTVTRKGMWANAYLAHELVERLLERANMSEHDQRHQRSYGAVRTTRNILDTLRTKDKDGRVNHSIPVADPIVLPDLKLPIDPYLLGVWLGDGHSCRGSFAGIDHEIVRIVESNGYALIKTIQKSIIIWRVTGLTSLLRNEKLLKRKGDQETRKHIPAQYLRASIQQRRDLLAGLLDTGGTVTPQGTIHFTNTNRNIAYGVWELALTLGYHATINEGRSKLYGKNYGPKWTIVWTCADSPFRLTRKTETHRSRNQSYNIEKNKDRYIVDVRPVASKPGRCIMVDSPSRLFLAGDTFIPTHNSVTQRTILMHVLQSPEWRTVMCDPKRVELSMYEKSRNVLRIATELADMTELIEQVEQEMYARYDKMKEEGVNHFSSLESPPPAVLLMVDEVFALLSLENVKSDEGKERDELHARCTTLIGSIARLGRAAGVHMVLATQRPDAKVLPGETRANLDCRIAQGRMDTTPSLMTLDSDAATRIPGVKGRAVVRTGNEYTEFQAYFLPNEQLAQVLEMSDALAGGVISVEELLAEGDPDGDGISGENRFARLKNGGEELGGKLFGLKIFGRVGETFKRVPGLGAVKTKMSNWVERRQRVVDENERRAGRGGEKNSGGSGVVPVGNGVSGGRGATGTAGTDLSVKEVADVSAGVRERPEVSEGPSGGAELFAQVSLPDLDEVEVGFGVLVADVLRESALRGVPVSASELVAALRAGIVASDSGKDYRVSVAEADTMVSPSSGERSGESFVEESPPWEQEEQDDDDGFHDGGNGSDDSDGDAPWLERSRAGEGLESGVRESESDMSEELLGGQGMPGRPRRPNGSGRPVRPTAGRTTREPTLPVIPQPPPPIEMP